SSPTGTGSPCITWASPIEAGEPHPKKGPHGLADAEKMTTTLTIGDVLIHTLIFFGGASALWVLQKFWSSFSDYLARRSTKSRLKKIDSLEQILSKYEADFSDVRLFV